MCGIVAIVRATGDVTDEVSAMCDALVHRGPDEAGGADVARGVAIAMRRLSIVDIQDGSQPIWNEDRSCAVVFNGEIYNAPELREQLRRCGHQFATDHSDTEVLVHGYEEWRSGLFERLNGMFAVAIWDSRRRKVIVARDRTGEKPLYIARLANGYAVASELKAFATLRDVDRSIDAVALEQYLAFDYAMSPRTMFTGVKKLPAAAYAEISASGVAEHVYWTPEFNETSITEEDAVDRLDNLLDRSVARRMISDVPLGLFLSGGLDSTTVGYYMRRHASDVRSFSIGFEDEAFDESAYARIAADAIGTDHHLEVFSPSRVRELLPRVADILDEPMGDQSIFPTYLLSLFTRSSVKVALGGDGSDELLMGYKAFRPLKAAWAVDPVPPLLRRCVATVARRTPARACGRAVRGVLLARTLDRRPVERLLAHLGSFKGDARWILSSDLTERLNESPFDDAERELLSGIPSDLTPAQQTVAAYLRGYLPEDILVKVDRASMAASLEVRAPFLDPDVVDFALRTPTSLRLNGFTGKYLLRRLMRGRIPDVLIDRPKTGFGVPLNRWLRDELSPLVRTTLTQERLREGGIFNPAGVMRLVGDHLSGRQDYGHRLWLILQFELWRERWVE